MLGATLFLEGMEKASGAGEWGNLDKTLGKQAGATLARSLDQLFHEKGMAILKKCPSAAGWKGGHISWGYCPPHAEYHILKRARLDHAGRPTAEAGHAWRHAAALGANQEGVVPPGAKGRERRTSC